tara:strand:- start:2594 stop:2908 length:315 start_codon:yes stop_codon:yes gene_type:complete
MFNIEQNYNESKWGVNSEELFNSPEERANLAHFEVINCTVNPTTKAITKILDRAILDTLDKALVQMDRYNDYGMSEVKNHHVIIMQGKVKPSLIKHWQPLKVSV